MVAFEDWRGMEDGPRRQQVQSQLALAENHKERLEAFIRNEDLSSGVYSVAAATSLGLIGIIATGEAAGRVAEMSGVLRVIPAR